MMGTRCSVFTRKLKTRGTERDGAKRKREGKEESVRKITRRQKKKRRVGKVKSRISRCFSKTTKRRVNTS